MSAQQKHASSEATAAVACQDLTRRYSRGSGSILARSRTQPTVTALDDVSLAIHPGEFVGVAGPSGSGKSTLLHLLAGLDLPTEGAVHLDGTDTGSLSERGRARLRLETVGIVFQHFHLLPSLSARANVALPLVERGVGTRARRERASTLLAQVGLGDRSGHKPGELSGGEQQRVAIARALATDPALVIADEPTGELDSATGERVLDLLSATASDRAVVVASHDETVLQKTDRVIRLRDGRLESDG
jgi:putative ABC transport system ATP-binding protein